jgi:ATP-binding cassette subfamily B protein
MREMSPRGAGRPGPAGNKPTSYGLKPLGKLLPFIVRYPWRLAIMLLFLCVGSLSSLVLPSFAGAIIDKGFSAKNLDMVTTWGWAIIGLAALMAVSNGMRFYMVSALGERILTDLRRSVFDHLLSLDSAFFDTHRVGELTSRLNGDVGTVRSAVSSTLASTLRGLVTLIGAVALMFYTSPYLAIGVVVVAPALTIPMVVIGRRLRRMSRRAQDAIAEMSAQATEALGATKTIKSFTQESV